MEQHLPSQTEASEKRAPITRRSKEDPGGSAKGERKAETYLDDKLQMTGTPMDEDGLASNEVQEVEYVMVVRSGGIC